MKVLFMLHFHFSLFVVLISHFHLFLFNYVHFFPQSSILSVSICLCCTNYVLLLSFCTKSFLSLEFVGLSFSKFELVLYFQQWFFFLLLSYTAGPFISVTRYCYDNLATWLTAWSNFKLVPCSLWKTEAAIPCLCLFCCDVHCNFSFFASIVAICLFLFHFAVYNFHTEIHQIWGRLLGDQTNCTHQR